MPTPMHWTDRKGSLFPELKVKVKTFATKQMKFTKDSIAHMASLSTIKNVSCMQGMKLSVDILNI